MKCMDCSFCTPNALEDGYFTNYYKLYTENKLHVYIHVYAYKNIPYVKLQLLYFKHKL